MNYKMTTVAFLVVLASLIALLVVGTEGIGSIHVAFANKGINVQIDTSQDQGCEAAGGTSGITNACIATSGRSSTQTTVTLSFRVCITTNPPINNQFTCSTPVPPNNCNNIGCQSVSCDFIPSFGPPAAVVPVIAQLIMVLC